MKKYIIAITIDGKPMFYDGSPFLKEDVKQSLFFDDPIAAQMHCIELTHKNALNLLDGKCFVVYEATITEQPTLFVGEQKQTVANFALDTSKLPKH